MSEERPEILLKTDAKTIVLELVYSARKMLLCSQNEHYSRRIAPARQLVARELAGDRRLRPADRFGNRADRMAQSLGQTNLFSFVIRQMRIASRGNTP